MGGRVGMGNRGNGNREEGKGKGEGAVVRAPFPQRYDQEGYSSPVSGTA